MDAKTKDATVKALQKAISELHHDKQRLFRQIDVIEDSVAAARDVLERLGAGSTVTILHTTVVNRKSKQSKQSKQFKLERGQVKGKRRVSAATRKKQSEAAKQRWARERAKAFKTNKGKAVSLTGEVK